MDEVLDFCLRVLGPGPAAPEAADTARAHAGENRLAALTAAVSACRARASEPDAGTVAAAPEAGQATFPAGESGELRAAVARELAQASATLPEPEREVLALREPLQLPYAEIAAVMGLDADAVGPLLADARLHLRDARRGPLPAAAEPCPDRERALALLARRQDGEAMPDADEEWLHAHLMRCPSCEMAHAAMLEASLCYRGWHTA